MKKKILILFFSLILIALLEVSVNSLGEVTKTSGCGGSCPSECAAYSVSCTSSPCSTTCTGIKVKCREVGQGPAGLCGDTSWTNAMKTRCSSFLTINAGGGTCYWRCEYWLGCPSSCPGFSGVTQIDSQPCTYSCPSTQYSCTYDTDKDDDGFDAAHDCDDNNASIHPGTFCSGSQGYCNSQGTCDPLIINAYWSDMA